MDLEKEEVSSLGASRASGHFNSTENTGYLVPFLSQRSEDSGYNQTYVLDSDQDNVFLPPTRRPRRNTTTIYIWYRKVASTSPSCLEAHAGFFQIVYEVEIWSLFISI